MAWLSGFRPAGSSSLIKRLFIVLMLMLILGAAFLAIHLSMPGWYARWWYPLDHAAAIREDAVQNHLDPYLVAAVIYQESRFKQGTISASGAIGLMQLMPATAGWIAAEKGERAPAAADLKQSDLNIRFGCWYLAYLLERYGGSKMLALAAYNGGAENVDRWMAAARASGRPFDSAVDIPYQETRDYVENVDKVEDIYKRAYGGEL